MQKRTVPQAVFDSPEALRIAREATTQAQRELDATPRHMLGLGNPNHPDNFTTKLFGQPESEFIARQYRTEKTQQ